MRSQKSEVDARRRILGSTVLLAVVLSAGCVHAQAKTVGPDPVLTTPDPPARVLIPVPPEALLPPTPTPEPTPTPTAGRTTIPLRPTPTPTSTPVPTPTPVENPAPVLQTGNMGVVEAQARAQLDRAEKDFNKLKRDSLGPDARDNYDSAARYIRLARQALNDKNFPYAKNCADKAAIIAGLLIKLEVSFNLAGISS